LTVRSPGNSPRARAKNEKDERWDMKCPKCKGLMVQERFADDNAAFYEWKCVNCGHRRPVAVKTVTR
jgi:DNA-directed RNA polymerase subunit M/transcription elongation factor TFIIS